MPVYGEWVGTVDGFVNADLKAQVVGTIVRQDYHEGDRVRRGQLMFEIDPRPFEAALQQAQGQLAQARGQLLQTQSQQSVALASLTQARSQLLVARAAHSQAIGQLAQACANVAQAQASQRTTQGNLSRYTELAREHFITDQDLYNAQQANDGAIAQVQAARAQVQTQRGILASTQAQIKSAQASIGVAQAQVSAAGGAVDSAQAQVTATEAGVNAASLNLGYTRVTSPIDGLAGIAHVQVGNLVGPTSTALATVSTMNPARIIFPLTQDEYLDYLRPHQKLQKAQFEITLTNGSVYPERAHFYAEDRQIGASTGAILMVLTVPNPGLQLRPGQYARVRAVRYVDRNAVLVPQRAVDDLQGMSQVIVVGTDNRATFRNVEMGTRYGTMWVVKKGLKEGERIVTEGLTKVRDGSLVHPISSAGSSRK